ncbi:unnamed protein product [Withania somnifera]
MPSSSSSPFLLHYRKISAFILVVCLILFWNSSLRKERVSSQLDVPSNQLYTIEMVNEFPHDPDAFTQGLVYAENDTLFESTGLNGASSVRKVTLQTGKVKAIQRMLHSDFGVGLTLLGDRVLTPYCIFSNSVFPCTVIIAFSFYVKMMVLSNDVVILMCYCWLIQVTWRQSTGYIYDRHNLSKFEKFRHGMPDGWELATDGKVLYGSDGSSTLYQIDPQTMKVVKKQIVKYQGDEVHRLNELEYVYAEVWANVWMTDCIARISHTDGSVFGWILLHNLREGLLHNLIKSQANAGRSFYEIKLHPLKTPFNGDIKQICMPPAFPFS